MEKNESDGSITMSESICGGVTLLGMLMVIGGTTQHIVAGGFALIAIAILIYTLVNDGF